MLAADEGLFIDKLYINCMLRMTSVKWRVAVFVVLASAFFIISIAMASLVKADTAPTITTDKDKYVP